MSGAKRAPVKAHGLPPGMALGLPFFQGEAMRGGGKLGLCRMVSIVLIAAACASGSSARREPLTVSDGWIKTRAENEIEALLGKDADVRVRAKAGIVFLEGTVRDIADAERIEERVTEIRGVREVKNELRVKP